MWQEVPSFKVVAVISVSKFLFYFIFFPDKYSGGIVYFVVIFSANNLLRENSTNK
jgi:hypothetical protein